MALWSVYVLLKVLLQWAGCLRLEPVPELAAYALILVLSRRKDRSRVQHAWLCASGAALAAALLWRESFLPPFTEALRYLIDPALRPSRNYFFAFLRNLLEPWRALGVAAAGFGVHVLRGRPAKYVTPFAAAVLLAALLFGRGPDPARLAREAGRFHDDESRRSVILPEPKGDFDVIIVHVCSLSWSDLWRTGLQRHPFLSRLDVLFSRFNTVSSYSEQAALRLLRAPCGQARDDALYEAAPPSCGLADALRSRGYRLDAAMNHRGDYLLMSQKLSRFAGLPAPLELDGLKPVATNFDDSPIYDDYEVLERWWAARRASGARRAALYYNTVSLHTAAYPSGHRRAWAENAIGLHRRSAENLFSALERFVERVERDGGRAVFLFVPEHGGAIEGSQYLLPGMRDLPLPSLTLVPAGARIIGGAPDRERKTEVVEAPSSYLALAGLLAGFMERPPFGNARKGPRLPDLPATRWVAENKRMVLLAGEKDLYMRWMDKKWVRLPRKFHPEKVPTRPTKAS